ncbi:hypothetical protein GGR76_002213, partial [Xanthomonas translucens]|nr:hypothetical protein [Xanthomonas campestris]
MVLEVALLLPEAGHASAGCALAAVGTVR